MAGKTVDDLTKEIEQLKCQATEEVFKREKAEGILRKLQKSFSDDSDDKSPATHHAWGMIDAYFDLLGAK